MFVDNELHTSGGKVAWVVMCILHYYPSKCSIKYSLHCLLNMSYFCGFQSLADIKLSGSLFHQLIVFYFRNLFHYKFLSNIWSDGRLILACENFTFFFFHVFPHDLESNMRRIKRLDHSFCMLGVRIDIKFRPILCLRMLYVSVYACMATTSVGLTNMRP